MFYEDIKSLLSRIDSIASGTVQEDAGDEAMPTLQIQKDTAELLFKEVPEYRKKYKTVQNFMQSQEFRDHLARYWHNPKNIVKQRDQGLDKDIAKMYKEWVYIINDTTGNPQDIESDYNWGYGPDDDSDARALAKAFNTSLEAGLQLLKKIKIDREKERRAADWDPFNPDSEQHDELKAMFAKYGKKLKDFTPYETEVPAQEDESYEPFPEADEMTFEDDDAFYEAFGEIGYPEDEVWEAEYRGRKVPLNKPMRGDVKKFKVYVKDPKSGNIKKVNFGHGGSSARRAGQKTMKIRKSNPKARKSFRARHNCANPGPKTKARYWSCRKW